MNKESSRKYLASRRGVLPWTANKLGRNLKSCGFLLATLGLGSCYMARGFGSERKIAVIIYLCGIAMGAVGSILAVLGELLDRKDAKEQLQSDTRAPILFLRPFRRESAALLERLARFISYFGGVLAKNRLTPEEHLSEILSRFGPFIALGRPGEILSTPGAARDYVDDSEWKDQILDWIERSSLIVIQIGATRSLEWEIAQATKLKNSSELLIYLPGPDSSFMASISSRWRNARYKEFKEAVAGDLDLPDSSLLKQTRFIWFNPDGSPLLLQGAPRSWKSSWKGLTTEMDAFTATEFATALAPVVAFLEARNSTSPIGIANTALET